MPQQYVNLNRSELASLRHSRNIEIWKYITYKNYTNIEREDYNVLNNNEYKIHFYTRHDIVTYKF